MRKLRLTPEEIQEQTSKIIQMLQTAGAVTSSKINLTLDLGKIDQPPKEKCKVVFRPIAWLKMWTLVDEFSNEVAWHFLAERDPEDPLSFILTDVIVYPQEVTGTNVEMDEATYGQWLMTIPDDKFNHIRGQGHSHVNMGVSPSGTDMDHQEKIVSQLKPDSENPFYVFVIFNKRCQIHFDVYDIENNVVYENNDVKYYIFDDDNDIVSFVSKAKELAVRKVYKTTATKTPTSIQKPAKQDTSTRCLDMYERDLDWEEWNRSFYSGK